MTNDYHPGCESNPFISFCHIALVILTTPNTLMDCWCKIHYLFIHKNEYVVLVTQIKHMPEIVKINLTIYWISICCITMFTWAYTKRNQFNWDWIWGMDKYYVFLDLCDMITPRNLNISNSLAQVWFKFKQKWVITQIAKIMGPTWGPPGSFRPQMGPMLATWTLLSGYIPLKSMVCFFIHALITDGVC